MDSKELIAKSFLSDLWNGNTCVVLPSDFDINYLVSFGRELYGEQLLDKFPWLPTLKTQHQQL